MLRCKICDEAIDAERIKSFLLASNGSSMPDTCSEHSEQQRPFGVMCEASDATGNIKNVGRKGGYVLITLDQNNPNFKEQMRQAKRFVRRAR